MSKTIIEYLTILECSLQKMDDSVNKAIVSGWQPFGVIVPLVALSNDDDDYYIQAMVKYELAQVPIIYPSKEQ